MFHVSCFHFQFRTPSLVARFFIFIFFLFLFRFACYKYFVISFFSVGKSTINSFLLTLIIIVILYFSKMISRCTFLGLFFAFAFAVFETRAIDTQELKDLSLTIKRLGFFFGGTVADHGSVTPSLHEIFITSAVEHDGKSQSTLKFKSTLLHDRLGNFTEKMTTVSLKLAIFIRITRIKPLSLSTYQTNGYKQREKKILR